MAIYTKLRNSLEIYFHEAAFSSKKKNSVSNINTLTCLLQINATKKLKKSCLREKVEKKN